MYKLDLIFNSGTRLKYESLNTEFATWYIETFVIPSIGDGKDNVMLTHTHFSFPTLSTQEELENLLNQNIEVLKSYGIPINFLSDNVTQEELNRLHEFFHTQVETSYKTYSGDPLLQKNIMELNYNIHKLEPLLREAKVLDKNYAIVPLNNFPESCIDLTSEQKKFFTYEFYLESLDLVTSKYLATVNYSTVGKNLFHAYMDNDIEVVKKNLIRSKMYGDNMLQYQFFDGPHVNRVAITRYERKFIEDWLEGYGINSTNWSLTDEDFNQFYPPILQMIEGEDSKFSVEDIHKLFTYDGIKSVEAI